MLGRAGIYYALSTPQMERATELHLLGKLPLLGPLFILNNFKVKKKLASGIQISTMHAVQGTLLLVCMISNNKYRWWDSQGSHLSGENWCPSGQGNMPVSKPAPREWNLWLSYDL